MSFPTTREELIQEIHDFAKTHDYREPTRMFVPPDMENSMRTWFTHEMSCWDRQPFNFRDMMIFWGIKPTYDALEFKLE